LASSSGSRYEHDFLLRTGHRVLFLTLETLIKRLRRALVARRSERASLIITSNWGFIDWGEVFGDQMLVTAIPNRLLRHSHTINIRGESFRLKEKRRAGLIEKLARPDAESNSQKRDAPQLTPSKRGKSRCLPIAGKTACRRKRRI
jgi:hypothetical protein